MTRSKIDEWITLEPVPERPDMDPVLEAWAEERIREYEEDIRLGILMGNLAENLPEEYYDGS